MSPLHGGRAVQRRQRRLRRAGLIAMTTLGAALLPVAASAQTLTGFVDMHTHPMSHLGFGGMIMYGAPDVHSLMLAGQKYRGYNLFEKECNTAPEEAGSVEGALSFCNAMHGGHGTGTNSFGDANDCGDYIRAEIVNAVDEKYRARAFNDAHLDHPHFGYPAFDSWPDWSSVTHQQMWWEWIKRAHAGGLRVMVSLAVNNTLLARAANATDRTDDKSSVDLQLREIKKLVANHADFMEVALTPADLRRIVAGGKLAVILGIETEDLGNLTRRRAFDGESISVAQVQIEVEALFEAGVRYVLPIHLSDSVLGGAALNKDLFALSSKFYSNAYSAVEESCDTGVRFRLSGANFDFPKADALRARNLGWVIDGAPTYPAPAAGCGHRNSLGLTPLGVSALEKMMQLGMLIDIDHMSERTADSALQLATTQGYPVSSGHNGMRSPTCDAPDPQTCQEGSRTRSQYLQIKGVGGMVGLGHGGTASNFVSGYRVMLDLMGDHDVAIGTDVNGLFPMPQPEDDTTVTYDEAFPRYQFGRAWDYNERGFAHYGLFPDFMRAWSSSKTPSQRITERELAAFRSTAEDFARLWERSGHRSTAIVPGRTGASATPWAIQSVL